MRYLPNAPATHVLVLRTEGRTPQQPIPVTRFFVYDRGSSRVVMEEPGVRGTVRWADDHHVRVDGVPGTMSTDPDQNERSAGYLVDVRTGARSSVRR